MAEKKADEKARFEAEVYKLGLELIEAYRTGMCSDRDKTLAAIIKLFAVSKESGFFNLEGE